MDNVLKDRFDKILDTMYHKNNCLTIEVMKMGYPQFSKQIPTAAVSFDDKKKKILFLFNKDFYQQLTDEQLEFIIAHEASHIIDGHILAYIEKQKFYKSMGKEKELAMVQKKMNIAQDCVINDSLVNFLKFPKIFPKEELEKNGMNLMYGKDVVGFETHNSTSEEIYSILTDDKVNEMMGGEHDWSSFVDENGNLKKEFVDRIKDFMKKNSGSSFLSDDDMGKVEKLKQQFKGSSDKNARQAGNEDLCEHRSVEQKNVNLRWEKLLSSFVVTRKTRDVWNRCNRKLYNFYPDIILPKTDDEEQQDITVFVDASGSIDYNVLSLFISLLENVPQHIKIRCFTFNTSVYPYEIRKDKKPIGGGGTNFQILEDYINSNIKKYPKFILVLTDGEGTHIKPKHPDRWCWLLYNNCMKEYIKDMKHHDLKDFIK